MRKRVREHIVVCLGSLVATILFTWPVTGQLSSHVAGRGGDPWQSLWRFETSWDQVRAAGKDNAVGALVAQQWLGGGEPRLVNLTVWPWLWLQPIVAQPMAYNIVWLLSFVLAGVGMYWLARWTLQAVTGDDGEGGHQQWAAGVAALYYMLLPYHLAHAQGHFGALQIQWLPFIFLAAARWVTQPTWRWGGTLVGLLILQAWSEHHYALWIGITGVVLGIVYWRRIQACWRQPGVLPQLVVFLAIGIVGVLLPYWPTIRLALSPSSLLELGVDQTIRFSADIFSFVIPAPFHSWWGRAVTLVTQYFTGNEVEATQYLSVAVVLLILFFHQRLPRSFARLWVMVAAIFLVIALGPRLHIAGWVLPIPLPYALIDTIPPFSAVRAVARAGVMVGLATSLLLAGVVATQIRRRWVVVLLAVIVILEFLAVPIATQSYTIPAVYAAVRVLPGRRLLELPAATNYTAASRALYASRYTGKEVVGNIALERARGTAAFAVERSLPGLRQLLYLRTTHLRQDRPEWLNQPLVETFLETAAWLDVGGILLHTDSLSTLQLATIQRFLEDDVGLAPQYYPDAILYQLPTTVVPGDNIFVTRDGRWQDVVYDADQDLTLAHLTEAATLTIYNMTGHRETITLQWQVPSGSPAEVTFGIEETMWRPLQEGDVARITLPASNGATEVIVRNEGKQPLVFQNFQLIDALSPAWHDGPSL